MNEPATRMASPADGFVIVVPATSRGRLVRAMCLFGFPALFLAIALISGARTSTCIAGVIGCLCGGAFARGLRQEYDGSPFETRFHFFADGQIRISVGNGKLVWQGAVGDVSNQVQVLRTAEAGDFLTWKDGIWVGITDKEASALESLGIRSSIGQRPRHTREDTWMIPLIVAIFAGTGVALDAPWASSGPSSTKITGTVTITNIPDVPEVRSVPTNCLAGRERGFDGVLFLFSEHDAVRELRIDYAQKGQNRIEVHFANLPPLIAKESECARISGQVARTNWEVNGREMAELKGKVEFDCLAHRIRGRILLEGCLP